jgi:hypothetical protein
MGLFALGLPLYFLMKWSQRHADKWGHSSFLATPPSNQDPRK